MKNYIENFGQFQKLNEQAEEKDNSFYAKNWEEAVDAICDGLTEEGLDAHGRTTGEDTAEIIINGNIIGLEKDYEYVKYGSGDPDNYDSLQFSSLEDTADEVIKKLIGAIAIDIASLEK